MVPPNRWLSMFMVGLLFGLCLFPASSTSATANASIVVNTLEDEYNSDGDCALREAIAASNFNMAVDACPGGDSSPDMITFSVSGTIVLGFHLPPIQNAGALVIDGVDQITISGNDTVRVFSVENDGNLTLKNLAVTDGYVHDEDGAGLYNDEGVVSIQNCTFAYNVAAGNSPWGGGAIYSRGGTTEHLTIADSRFNNNEHSLRGGAISAVNGRATIQDSSFHRNTAQWSGGAIYATYIDMTLDGSTFENNKAPGDSGGAINVEEASLQIEGGTFRSNEAKGGGAIGAVVGTDLDIAHTLMAQNQATWGGGAIMTGSLTDLTISQSIFDNNQGGARGGAISVTQSESDESSISECHFSANSADKGGAIHSDLLNGTIAGSTFYGNTSTGEGGALFSTSSPGPDYSDLFLINNTLVENEAGWGGAVYNSDSKVTLTNNTLSNNDAAYTGNNLYNDYQASGVLTVRNTIVADDNTGTNCFGAIADGGHNIDRGTTCGLDPAKGSLNDTDGRLMDLAENGGPTLTQALLTGSPAINAGDPALCPPTDQRGLARRSGCCDIGAFEAQPASLWAVGGSGQRTLFNTSFAQSLVAEVVDAYENPLGGVVITFTGPSSGPGISNSGAALISGANGRASFSAVANGARGGPYTVTAVASGLEAGYSLTNLGYSTATSITDDSPDPSESGQPFAVHFAVSSDQGTPTGLVTITVAGQRDGCSGPLERGAGSCTLTLVRAGSHTLRAAYGGDDRFEGSSAVETHTVSGYVPAYLPVIVR